MTLIKFLIEQNKLCPGMELQIVSPTNLSLFSTVNDMILDMEVDYRYREKYNLPVQNFWYAAEEGLRILKIVLEE